METLYVICVLIYLPLLIFSDESQISSKNIKELELSPFGTLVYNLATTSGVFDKLFDVNFSNAEASEAFYDAGRYVAANIGLSKQESLSTDLSKTLGDLFTTEINALDYFLIFVRTLEKVLNKKGVLKEDNAEKFASMYHGVLEDMVKSVGTVINSKQSLYMLTVAGENFLKKASDMNADDFVYGFHAFVNEANRVRHYKTEL